MLTANANKLNVIMLLVLQAKYSLLVKGLSLRSVSTTQLLCKNFRQHTADTHG